MREEEWEGGRVRERKIERLGVWEKGRVGVRESKREGEWLGGRVGGRERVIGWESGREGKWK